MQYYSGLNAIYWSMFVGLIWCADRYRRNKSGQPSVNTVTPEAFEMCKTEKEKVNTKIKIAV